MVSSVQERPVWPVCVDAGGWWISYLDHLQASLRSLFTSGGDRTSGSSFPWSRSRSPAPPSSCQLIVTRCASRYTPRCLTSGTLDDDWLIDWLMTVTVSSPRLQTLIDHRASMIWWCSSTFIILIDSSFFSRFRLNEAQLHQHHEARSRHQHHAAGSCTPSYLRAHRLPACMEADVRYDLSAHWSNSSIITQINRSERSQLTQIQPGAVPGFSEDVWLNQKPLFYFETWGTRNWTWN